MISKTITIGSFKNPLILWGRAVLSNERCFEAVTGDVADSYAEVIKKLVCRLIHRAKRLHGDWKKCVLFTAPKKVRENAHWNFDESINKAHPFAKSDRINRLA